jgi:hypothetical protein
MKKFIEIPADATTGVTVIVQGDKIAVLPIDDETPHINTMQTLLVAFISLMHYNERLNPEARFAQETIRCAFKDLDLEEVADVLEKAINMKKAI